MSQPTEYTDIEKMMRRIRQEYRFGKLDRKDLAADPFGQFAQ